MNFDFSDEQYAVRDVAREVFEREWSPARLREGWESPEPADRRVWKALAEVGILGLTTPEAFGGLGGTEIDLVLVLEEAGRAGIPNPLIDTLAVAAPLLAEAGAAGAEWMGKIASGGAVGAVQLEGMPFVQDADVADFVIVQVGDDLHLVGQDDLRASPVPSEDRSRRLFFVQATTSQTTRMPVEATAVHMAKARGATATASFLNGLSLRLLEMTLDHVKARQQFGRPIGSFQAVKHKMTSVHVAIEAARSAAWYAAYALANRLLDRDLAASAAKAAAADAGALAGTEALQCHGGIGFTWEHDLHLWLKRAKALEPSYGSASEHRQRLARSLIEGTETDDA